MLTNIITGIENQAAAWLLVCVVALALGGLWFIFNWILENFQARVTLRHTSSYSLPKSAPKVAALAPPSLHNGPKGFSAETIERARRQHLDAAMRAGDSRIVGYITPNDRRAS
jgi:hypothetical protein